MNKSNVVPFDQSAGFYERRGDHRFESGDHLEAMGLYLKAIQLDEANYRLHVKLGSVYNAMGAHRLALGAFCDGILLGGKDDQDLFFHMGACYMDLHSYDAAMVCFREMGRIQQESGEENDDTFSSLFSEALSEYLTENSSGESVSDTSRLEIANLSLEAMKKLGEGDNKSAIACFERAWAIDPASAEQASNLAMALYCDGQYARSLAVCDSALLNDRNTTRIHCIKALLYKATGDQPALEKETAFLINAPVADGFEAMKIGVTLFDISQLSGALAVFDRGLECAPYDTDLLHCSAVCLNNLGRQKEALLRFEMGLRVDPKDPVLLHYAELLKKRIDAGFAPEPIAVCFRDLPVDMVIAYTHTLGEMQLMSKEEILSHQDWSSMVEWSLRRSDSWHVAALNVLSTADRVRAERELRSRLCDASIPPEIQKTYLALLSAMGTEGPYTVMMESGVAEVSISVFAGLDELPAEYGQVATMLANSMSERQEPEQVIRMCLGIWSSFVNAMSQHPISINPKDVPAYCAAVEYSARRVLGERTTCKTAMELYSVSRYRFRRAHNALYDAVFAGDDAKDERDD